MNIQQAVEEQTALINLCVEIGQLRKAAAMARELAETLDRHCKVYNIEPTETEGNENVEAT